MPTPIISLDLETTGLDPSIHGPWEIAWATALHYPTIREIHVVNRQSWFVSLNGTEALDPIGLAIGGFMERYADPSAHGRRLPWWGIQHQLFEDLAQLRTAGMLDQPYLDGHSDKRVELPATHLIGACPQFDHRMLERWLGWAHRHWHHHLIDVETLMAGKHEMAPPYNTAEMTRLALGDHPTNPWGRKHEALGDVRWNLELYAHVYDAALIIPDALETL